MPERRNTYMIRPATLLGVLAASTLFAGVLTAQPAQHTFAVEGDHFALDGKPFVIRSGEMHYPRVPRQYWHDRMKKMRALGLNTLTTYVFWNLHEPKPGVWDFQGDLDLGAYLKAAQEEGLFVLLRPGPYVCAEWDLGGLPAWLLADEQMKIRSRDPKFLAAAGRYIRKIGEIAAPLQVAKGGPVLMVQVENEYGSYGDDHEYTGAIEKMLRGAGFDGTLYTADGSEDKMFKGGPLPGIPAVINFGASDNPEEQFANFAKFRTGVPKMVGEFWTGWFDHWGEKHHTTDPAKEAKNLEWLLSRGIGVNLYMVHGGTSWGPMAGANFSDRYEPDISSYDYDAPIDEAGRLTPKFYALREVFKRNLPAGETLPEPPEARPVVETPKVAFKLSAPLTGLLGAAVRGEAPLSMESLGQSYGLVLYRHPVAQAVHGTLELNEGRDYALVSQSGKLLGILDRRKKETRLEVSLVAGAPLEILVDAEGRVNFGPRLVDDRKGIVGTVKLNGEELKGWEMFPLPLGDQSKLKFKSTPAQGPAFYRATFDLKPAGDTFLDLSGWGKGYVWVNGHNLGRYWGVGPQQSLFCPGVWLRATGNQIVVLDLDATAARTIQGRTNPVWQTPGN
ncbi:MAG: beta-galactosidase [Bryobacteraceae bacterium]|nr:beta-galactosidase [Bryobacteraceae bacterium]